jgi:pimeloyl-ACP methyl ester carboxylesterase
MLAENIGQVSGRVVVSTGKTGQVHVIVFQPGTTDAEFSIVSDLVADPDGAFRVPVEPGNYFFGAFQDVNGDGAHQRETEPAAYFNSDGLRPVSFTVNASGRLQLEPLLLAGIFQGVPEVRTVDGAPAVTRNIGRVVSLDDPMFSATNATMGLWRPVDFLKQVGGGLFLLQAYRAGATPVIFIHGISGSPASFSQLVQGLDPSRFQPWVLYYPSGLRLDVVSDYLDRAVVMLQAKYGFSRIFVVAHSMGGLVARSFVKKHEARHQVAPVAFMMTINSPMLGMNSASMGVQFSPVVIPAWRDVARNSEFVKGLNAWPWPQHIPYHLVFSYEPGSGSDGVVSLESQIPMTLQDESARIYGFKGTHAGLLNDATFLRHFSDVMAKQDTDGARSQP